MNMKRARRYWVTVHYPPPKGETQNGNVYLKEGTQNIAANMSPGDYVIVYEARNGRDYYSENENGNEIKVEHEKGREGVVIISQVTNRREPIPNSRPTRYIDGTVQHWSWTVACKVINSSGYIYRKQFMPMIGYKESFAAHGFGKPHGSGLLEIREEQFNNIRTSYESKMKPLPESIHVPHAIFGKAVDIEEGIEHKRLKEAVFHNPEYLLEECGLMGYRMEFGFVTGDHADIILIDSMKRSAAVEIEIEVKTSNIAGLLQAIKYKYMFACYAKKEFDEVRAFLVAYSIDQEVKVICKKYGVEWFEIDKAKVS